MKKISVLIFMLSCLILSSCNKKQNAIDDLENFSEELKENSAEYTSQDWEEANAEYEQLVEQVDQYEYTDEELKEIGRLKARCLKQMSAGAMQQLQNGIHNFTKQLEGALEEFSLSDDNESDNPE